MSREYVVAAGGMTVANASPVTLLWINPSATIGFEILRIWIGQAANATSAQQRVQCYTQPTAFPTLGTGITPAKSKFTDPASGITSNTNGAAGTCGVNASAEGAGSKTVLIPDCFNVLNGYLWVPTPEERILMPAGCASGFGVAFTTAPATLTLWTAGLIFREL